MMAVQPASNMVFDFNYKQINVECPEYMSLQHIAFAGLLKKKSQRFLEMSWADYSRRAFFS